MEKVTVKNNVNHPQHYSGTIECIEYLNSVLKGAEGIEAFCLGNAIKYIHRFPFERNPIDIEKAIWYLDFIKRRVEGIAE